MQVNITFKELVQKWISLRISLVYLADASVSDIYVTIMEVIRSLYFVGGAGMGDEQLGLEQWTAAGRSWTSAAQ